ncbi:unnamed protein product [Closterium sp. NIES-53]
MVGVVEQTVTLEPEAGEYFRAVAAAVQANLMVVLLVSGCSHHLMGTKEAFVDNAPSGDVKHVRGFNEALQTVEGRGIVALQGEAGKQVLILDMLYVPGVQANLLSAGQLKENGVLLQDDGNEMMLVNATGQVLIDRGGGSADDCIGNEVDAAQVAREACKRWHRHIKSSAKHNVATGLDIKPLTGTNLPCVSCVVRKLARHTFPDKGLDAEEALAIVHIDLCGHSGWPPRMAATTSFC